MGLLSSVGFLGLDDALGDLTGSSDATSAALQGNQASIDAVTNMFNRNVELNEPFRELGLRNLETLEGEVSGFTPQSRLDEIRSAFQTSPGFENALTLGRDQIEAGAAGQGSLFSGNTLKGLERFRTDLANQEFGNFSNQYNALADNRLNRLAALGGIGQTATGNLTSLGQQQGQNLSNAFMNQGSIQAAGAMAPFNNLLSLGQVAGGFA